MKRQVVSSVLARGWLWSRSNAIGCTGYHFGSRADCDSVRGPLSDRMPVLPGMLVKSYAAEKELLSSTRANHLAVRSSGHDLLAKTFSGRRGLQAFASPQNALNLKPCVVIYDGVCHLCNAGVNWIIKADKKKAISFCALQSRAAQPYLLLCGLTREDVWRRFVFIEGPDSCHQGSTAALKVASYLPLPYSALSIFTIIPAPIRDAVYDYVAKRRYQWFGQSTECITPSEDVLDRFVDKLEIQERTRDGQYEEEQVNEKSG
ncbi:hypothetical protein KC19_2G066700 [Ceratodon purpureus]|uniref:Thiol-disulfide oxidoreductase DCC n=1 Tax=Ceratodon purpureus TaxID=3225 RepID=A0A8T0ISI9_CERPU|nr:hypothetical protein KC19_2G066700 [Ceratodon purpureus]